MATTTKSSLRQRVRRTKEVTLPEIRQWLTQFLALKEETADLTKRQNDVKDWLKAAIERQGYADDKGNQYIDLDVPIDGVKTLKREKRVTPTLNEERTEALLRKKKIFDRCTTTVTVLDEDKILGLLYEEDDKGEPLLTQDDVDAMFDQSITYAFVPMRENNKGRKKK